MNARRQSVGSAPLPTIWTYLDRFRAYMRAEKKSENTVLRYADTVGVFLDRLQTPAHELTKRDMQEYKEFIAAKYCENSMSTMIAAINHFTANILERPDLDLKAPRRVDKPGLALTEDEVQAILKKARETDLRTHAMVSLMYYGGLRASEVMNARISDMDFDRKVLRIHGGKGKDYSTVNLSKYAVRAVREYVKVRPDPARAEHGDMLFLSKTGAPMARNRAWRSVKLLCQDAGISKNVYPHLFRHSMITHMAEKGLSAPLIQAQSRHRSMDMLQKYIHLSQAVVREAYDQTMDTEEEPKAPEDTQKENHKDTKKRSEPDYSVSYVGDSKPSIYSVGYSYQIEPI